MKFRAILADLYDIIGRELRGGSGDGFGHYGWVGASPGIAYQSGYLCGIAIYLIFRYKI